MEKPKLRRLVTYPAVVNGGQRIALEDPSRLSPKILFVSPDVPIALDDFNGENTLEDIAAAFLAKMGRLLSKEELARVVQELDQNLMLESPRFAETRQRLIEAWRAASHRPPTQAGIGYPQTPAEITTKFNEYLKNAGGPGKTPVDPRMPMALLTPGLDPRASMTTAVGALEQLRGHNEIELFVLLATAQVPMKNCFTALRKTLVTPYGPAVTDNEFVEAVASKLPFKLHDDEWAFRTDNAVEFQLVFLQWLFGGQLKAKVAPILAGNLQPTAGAGASPRQTEAVGAFVEALGREVERRAGKVCVIAGVELAHIGSRYGDTVAIDEKRRQWLGQQDRAILDAIATCDAEKFYASVMRDKNTRRITGWPAIYTMLAALKPKRAQLLRYGHLPDAVTNSVVSFASAAFYTA